MAATDIINPHWLIIAFTKLSLHLVHPYDFFSTWAVGGNPINIPNNTYGRLESTFLICAPNLSNEGCQGNSISKVFKKTHLSMLKLCH